MITTHDSAEKASHPGAGRYVLGFAALVLLTGLTFALSTVELGAWSLVVALGIAITKGSIIALYFMHLRDHAGASRLVLAIAVIFVAVLSLLVVADVLTRYPGARPGAQSQTAQ
jgi:cytochrome c oxidase subunit IV